MACAQTQLTESVEDTGKEVVRQRVRSDQGEAF